MVRMQPLGWKDVGLILDPQTAMSVVHLDLILIPSETDADSAGGLPITV